MRRAGQGTRRVHPAAGDDFSHGDAGCRTHEIDAVLASSRHGVRPRARSSADRAPACGAGGREFNSPRARHPQDADPGRGAGHYSPGYVSRRDPRQTRRCALVPAAARGPATFPVHGQRALQVVEEQHQLPLRETSLMWAAGGLCLRPRGRSAGRDGPRTGNGWEGGVRRGVPNPWGPTMVTAVAASRLMRSRRGQGLAIGSYTCPAPAARGHVCRPPNRGGTPGRNSSRWCRSAAEPGAASPPRGAPRPQQRRPWTPAALEPRLSSGCRSPATASSQSRAGFPSGNALDQRTAPTDAQAHRTIRVFPVCCRADERRTAQPASSTTGRLFGDKLRRVLNGDVLVDIGGRRDRGLAEGRLAMRIRGRTFALITITPASLNAAARGPRRRPGPGLRGECGNCALLPATLLKVSGTELASRTQ